MNSILNALSSNICIGISSFAYLGSRFSQSRSPALNTIRYVSTATGLIGAAWRIFKSPIARNTQLFATPIPIGFATGGASTAASSLVNQVKTVLAPTDETTAALKPAREPTAEEEIEMRKMERNAEKAIKEHRQRDPKALYATIEDVAKSVLNYSSKPLQFTKGEVSDIGRSREENEDAHFYQKLPMGGILAGIFDGHGGKTVAEFVNQRFPKLFPSELTRTEGRVREAFERVVAQIERELKTQDFAKQMGSTAVVSFIDQKNRIFTATLADSEANIYRQFNGTTKSIPLSPIRDWSSQKDAKRARFNVCKHGRIRTVKECVEEPNSKDLRLLGNLNVSRAFGDFWGKEGLLENQGLSSKPKISVAQLLPGDTIVLGCDGLKDYLSENAIIGAVKKEKNPQKLADRLKKDAINGMSSKVGDNITIIVIKAVSAEAQIRSRL